MTSSILAEPGLSMGPSLCEGKDCLKKKKHKIRKIYPDLTPGLDALALTLALLLRLTFAAPVVEMCGKLEGHG